MEKFVDTMLNNIFGGMTTQLTFINIIGGILLIIVGAYLLLRKSSKVKQYVGWACIGIGSLGVLARLLMLLV